MKLLDKKNNRDRRHKRIRAKVKGTADKPRLSVFKSNTAVFAQLIDDEKGMTIAAVSSRKVKGGKVSERALETGREIAKLGKGKGVTKVVFDRGGFIYTGKIKAIAEGAREGGLIF